MAEAYMADMMAAAKERQANRVNEEFFEFQATDATMSEASESSHSELGPSSDPHIRVGDSIDITREVTAQIFSKKTTELYSSSLYFTV